MQSSSQKSALGIRHSWRGSIRYISRWLRPAVMHRAPGREKENNACGTHRSRSSLSRTDQAQRHGIAATQRNRGQTRLVMHAEHFSKDRTRNQPLGARLIQVYLAVVASSSMHGAPGREKENNACGIHRSRRHSQPYRPATEARNSSHAAQRRRGSARNVRFPLSRNVCNAREKRCP
jgi:hypothetical protein